MAPPQVDYAYGKQIESARQQLKELISKNKRYYAPLMLHLALHDAGIYGFITGAANYLIKRGPNGSIGTQAELSHPSNKGLKKAVESCAKDEVKRNNNKITYADLYQLAGVVAVQNTGVPPIEFVPGREDSTKFPGTASLRYNKLDESTLEKIRKHMGLEEKDMVALFGGLHLWSLKDESKADNEQKKASDQSPPDGSKADNEQKKASDQSSPDGSKADNEQKKASDDINKPAELKFDNSYFRNLKTREPQNLFLNEERFSKWVKIYAEDNNAFLADYAAAHKKVSEIGMSVAGKQTDQKTSAPPSRNRVRLVQGIGIAVVTTAIILGFFLSRRSK